MDKRKRGEGENMLGDRLQDNISARAETRGFSEQQAGSQTYDGNPLVDVRTGAGHADVRLGGLWNRHVWKKGTIYFE